MTQLTKQQNSVGIIKSLPNTSNKSIQIYNAYKTAKKLQDFSSKEDLLLLSSLILRWAQYVGAKQPDAKEVNTFANFIKESFPKFNAYDIQECITLLVQEKLETDANSYGSMSIIYISKVLKAYQAYRSSVIVEVNQKLEKIALERVVPPTEKERIHNFKLILSNAKEDVSKGEVLFDTGDIIYNFIKHNKLIQMNKDLISKAMEYGEDVFSKKAKQQALKDVINSVTFSHFVKEDIVKKYAREYVVNLWVKQTDIKLINQKITIEMLQY
jgi:hypothetical protein